MQPIVGVWLPLNANQLEPKPLHKTHVMAASAGSNGLAQCCELLGQPMHPLHASACAQLDVWEGERPDELCLALAHLLCMGQDGVADATRQMAGIALKNAISRRWQALSMGTVTRLREAALESLRASSPLVRSGGAALVERLASFGWPGLAESLVALCGDDGLAIDGALRAIDALASNSDDERPRRRRLRIAWPADDSECCKIAAAVARHFEHTSPAVRQRALRCARLVGWVDREAEAVVITKLAARSYDGDAGVREEVLRALRTLAPRLDEAALKGVAEHAIISLADLETRVAKRAAVLLHDMARLGRESATGSLHALVPALLRAMRYTVDDVNSFAAEAQFSTLAFPDRPEDVRPGRESPSSDDDSIDDEDEDNEDDLDNEDHQGDYDDGSWTLRKCAAATLDALARVYGSLLLDAALPHIARALEGQHTQPTESTMGPRGGDAPASTPSGVWEREAALLALGAISEGCCLGLRPHAASVAPFLLSQLENPIPQIREIVAWVIARASTKWFFSFSLAERRRRRLQEGSRTTVSTKEDEPLLAACVEALLKVLCVDEHKRVLESATAAAAAIFHVAGEAVRPYARPAAAILAAAISRFQLRARLEAYEAAVTLASRVGLDGDTRLALLSPLEARWQEEVADPGRDLDASWPFLECFRAIARTEKATHCHDTALIYERAAGRCVHLVRAADTALADESLPIDHARSAAGIGAFALDLIAGLAHALGGDRIVGVVATAPPGWAVIDAALGLVNACDYNGTEDEALCGTDHKLNRSRPELCRPTRAARDVQRTALASAAAILLGKLLLYLVPYPTHGHLLRRACRSRP